MQFCRFGSFGVVKLLNGVRCFFLRRSLRQSLRLMLLIVTGSLPVEGRSFITAKFTEPRTVRP